MHSAINLRDYRMEYPDTSAFPTLTQSGALALALERQRYKAVRLARQRERRRLRREAIRNALSGLWEKLTAGIARHSDASPIAVSRDA